MTVSDVVAVVVGGGGGGGDVGVMVMTAIVVAVVEGGGGFGVNYGHIHAAIGVAGQIFLPECALIVMHPDLEHCFVQTQVVAEL